MFDDFLMLRNSQTGQKNVEIHSMMFMSDCRCCLKGFSSVVLLYPNNFFLIFLIFFKVSAGSLGSKVSASSKLPMVSSSAGAAIAQMIKQIIIACEEKFCVIQLSPVFRASTDTYENKKLHRGCCFIFKCFENNAGWSWKVFVFIPKLFAAQPLANYLTF